MVHFPEKEAAYQIPDKKDSAVYQKAEYRECVCFEIKGLQERHWKKRPGDFMICVDGTSGGKKAILLLFFQMFYLENVGKEISK